MKKGFTLAEVLITLGIIGIVAAMTIPTLVANYQERSWGTAATVFERKLEEALKTMNTQQSLAGYTTTEDFVAELSKHFKILKTCDNTKLTDCFSDTVYWGGGTATPEEVDMSVVKTSKNFGQNDWGTNIVGVQFANGTNGLIAYNPITSSDDSTVKVCKQDPYSNQITGSDCLAILYDTSGYKSPNTSGKDLRANEHVKSLGSGCAFKIGETCYTTTPFIPTPHEWKACDKDGATTNEDDLAFMQKYGIKYCLNSLNGKLDYWAGAVAACGGVDKMPTMQQVADIATFIYGMPVSTKNQTECPSLADCRDDAKAAALGFDFTSYDHVLSGQEMNAYIGYNMEFHTFRASAYAFNLTYRHINDAYAVCLDN